MSPIDPTPQGGEVTRPPEEPRFPEPKSGRESDAPVPGRPGARGDVQPGMPARPRGTGPDVAGAGQDPILGAGNDVAG